MTLLAGYADRLSVRPGETIRFHVSNGTGTEAASPSIVRVISADPNPAGPGIRTRAVDAMVCTIAQCLPQSAVPGSYGVANLGGVLDRLGSLTVIATICPTRIAGEGRPIVTCGGGFELAVAKDGTACGSIRGSDGVTSVSTGIALPEGTWARVWMTWDATTSTITVGQQALMRGQPNGQATVSTSHIGGQILAAGTSVLIGASESDDRRITFNGRIERPMLFDRLLDEGEIERVAQGELIPGLVAGWDCLVTTVPSVSVESRVTSN